MFWETETSIPWNPAISLWDPGQCYLNDHSIGNLEPQGGRVEGPELLSRAASVHLLWKSWMLYEITAFLWNLFSSWNLITRYFWTLLRLPFGGSFTKREDKEHILQGKKNPILWHSLSLLLMVKVLFLPML